MRKKKCDFKKSGGPLDRLTQPIFQTVEVAEIIPYRRVKAYENVSFLTDLYLKRQWSLRRISGELGCCKYTDREVLACCRQLKSDNS